MHGKSIEYYNQNTDEFINRTICADMSFCQKKFTELLLPGSYILDAGCGSGRDSKLFTRSNEPSASLLAFGDCRGGQIPRPLGRAC